MATAYKRKKSDQEQGGRFRILIGDHLDDGPPGCECEGCVDGLKNHRYTARRYGRDGGPMDPPDYDGDIIESKKDLTRHNKGPNSRKFERLQKDEAVRPVPVTDRPSQPRHGELDKMSHKDLVAFAETQEIGLGNAKSREEILKIIKESL